jgi:hypothetical protein
MKYKRKIENLRWAQTKSCGPSNSVEHPRGPTMPHARRQVAPARVTVCSLLCGPLAPATSLGIARWDPRTRLTLRAQS